MQTHTTLNDARDAARGDSSIKAIAEIDHATNGRCYIKLKCTVDQLRNVLADPRNKQLPELTRIVDEHDVLTSDERSAADASEEAKRRAARANCKCDRCGTAVDGNTCYSQKEWARLGGARVQINAYYCADCAKLLNAIGAGERTEMQERAAFVPSSEPYTNEE